MGKLNNGGAKGVTRPTRFGGGKFIILFAVHKVIQQTQILALARAEKNFEGGSVRGGFGRLCNGQNPRLNRVKSP